MRNAVPGTILIAMIIIMLARPMPALPHSKQWRNYPGGGFGRLLLFTVILPLMDRIKIQPQAGTYQHNMMRRIED